MTPLPSHGSLSLAVQGDDAKWAYGPFVSRFGPLNFNAAVAANMALDIELTAPGSPDWPKVIYRGTGAFGGASTGLAVHHSVAVFGLCRGGHGY
jgi:hypothetical protein